MSGVEERLRESDDRVADLMRSAAQGVMVRQCIANRKQAYATEYPGADGDTLFELIGLSREEAANLECNPDDPIVDHYHRYRAELEGRGDVEALGRFHQHVDGIYVYIRSGLKDDSGFRDVGSWKIDRTDTDFESASLGWLMLAGLHAYSLGPSARRSLEADAREQVMGQLHDIGVALRTSEYFSNDGNKYLGNSTTYGCILELLADPLADVRYFTVSDYANFERAFNVDALVREPGWGELYATVVTNRGSLVSKSEAERQFGDLVFAGIALPEFSSDLRADVETSAGTWLDDEGEIDYRAVRRTMDAFYTEFEKAIDHVKGKAGITNSIEGDDLEPLFIMDRGLDTLSNEPSSPYSCRDYTF